MPWNVEDLDALRRWPPLLQEMLHGRGLVPPLGPQIHLHEIPPRSRLDPASFQKAIDGPGGNDHSLLVIREHSPIQHMDGGLGSGRPLGPAETTEMIDMTVGNEDSPDVRQGDGYPMVSLQLFKAIPNLLLRGVGAGTAIHQQDLVAAQNEVEIDDEAGEGLDGKTPDGTAIGGSKLFKRAHEVRV